MKRNQEHGVALVTTLIMLSLITFTAVVFLALSSRERDSVKIFEEIVDAKTMAEAGFMEAQAQVVAKMNATTNRYLYDAMVSRTYAPNGPVTTRNPVPESTTNDIMNLRYAARAPVYFQTNSDPTLPWEFRFYLDLDENGYFEPSGYLGDYDDTGSLTGSSNYYVGDPEWRGVLQNSFPTNFGGPPPLHSRTNKFGGRYAWLVLPYGKSLDLNHLHNYAKRLDTAMGTYSDSYVRDHGFGSYELNLASFLAVLNSNVWNASNYWTFSEGITPPYYEYTYANAAAANRGLAFVDALALLSHRYNESYTNLASISSLYGAVGGTAFGNDYLNGYLNVPPITGQSLPTNDLDNTTYPWSGSANTNYFSSNYFNIFELLSRGRTYSTRPNNTDDNFRYRLLSVGRNNSSYNRYTFYRLLSQLGTDTSLPSGEKVDINYNNIKPNSTTDFKPWTPAEFFNEAAERLLRTNFNIALTDSSHTNRIQIYPTNTYTAAIHRLLQLTANIYDATTNRGTDYPYFPSVFRPIFTNESGIIYITRYEEVTNSAPVYYAYITRDQATNYPNIDATNVNIWGVPWVVGVKKGLPAFNEFALRSAMQVSRRLEFIKANTNSPVQMTQTNQMYILGISNLLGAETWNPYTNAYPRPVTVAARLDTLAVLTNENGTVLKSNVGYPTPLSTLTNQTIVSWTSNAFYLPFYTNFVFMPDSQFFDTVQAFSPLVNNSYTNSYERGRGFYIPRWGLGMTNRLYCAMIDQNNDRVLDYVNYDGFNFGFADINNSLLGLTNALSDATLNTTLIRDLFRTNRVGGNSINNQTYGVQQQTLVSLGSRQVSQQDWNNYGLQNLSVQDKNLAIATFQRFMGFTVRVPGSPYHSNPNGSPQYYVKMPPSTNMQAPFTATAKVVYTNYWQANDPLVHYTMEDLGDSQISQLPPIIVRPASAPMVTNNLGYINARYRPWGIRQGRGRSSILPYDEPNPIDQTFEYRMKDPGIRKSDDWDFPGQKFGSVGWLGRVHRGTPWQTVYFKAGVMPDQAPGFEWRNWAGNAYTHPTNDWLLPDLFTIATDVNSASGLLSVNQTNMAAWAAVLGDVQVLTNTVDYNEYWVNTPNTPPAYTNMTIAPNSDQLARIIARINEVRAGKVVSLGNNLTTSNAFSRVGQILSVPLLSVGDTPTDSSPYLNLFDTNILYGVNDVVLERIPQQVLSLLKVEDAPRVVIYAWGQTLKPAPNSVILSGVARGVVTNYQVVSEYATRTVLRIEGAPQNPRTVIENFTILPADQ